LRIAFSASLINGCFSSLTRFNCRVATQVTGIYLKSLSNLASGSGYSRRCRHRLAATGLTNCEITDSRNCRADHSAEYCDNCSHNSTEAASD
jgi:hypothetical protein